jgi:hypothetical protein
MTMGKRSGHTWFAGRGVWVAATVAVGAGVVELSALAGAPAVASVAFGLAAVWALMLAAVWRGQRGSRPGDEGGGWEGGGRGPDPAGPGDPPGGDRFEWDAFECEFRAYAAERDGRGPVTPRA